MTKPNTFCPLLWEEMFVDQDATVYSCCHQKPFPLGSLNSSNMLDISRGFSLLHARSLSLQGKLECRRDCTILTEFSEPNQSHTLDAPFSGYRRLKLLFGEFCNIACVMCWQDHTRRDSLSFHLLRDTIDLSSFQEIDIQGGEPLAIKDAVAFYDYAAHLGKKLCLLTNGIPITGDWPERIARSCYRLHISLNAATPETHEKVNVGSSWDRVMTNVSRVFEAKRRLNSEVVIAAHMTIIPANVHEASRFIREMSRDFDEVSFFYDSAVPKYLTENQSLRSQFRGECSEALSSPNRVSLFGLSRLEELGLIAETVSQLHANPSTFCSHTDYPST